MASKNKRRSVSTDTGTVVKTVKTHTKGFSQEFNPDYSYVKQDLKKIGILAGSFFCILVLLSFFLR